MKRAVSKIMVAGGTVSTNNGTRTYEGDRSLGRTAPDVVAAYEAWERRAVEDKNAAFSLMESINDAS